ncbi:MAG: ice-binding family protein, partial [Rhodothermales bacterium]
MNIYTTNSTTTRCTRFLGVSLFVGLTALMMPADAFSQSPAPVELGAAGQFAILGGSTVTNTGNSIITGDLGLDPGTAVTGFPPGIVIGSIRIGDTEAVNGKADLTTAYNDAAGRSTNPISVAGNLGGQTLAPGLYKSTSSLEISSGNLTLDGGGDPNAVWIFQMASTLTVTS